MNDMIQLWSTYMNQLCRIKVFFFEKATKIKTYLDMRIWPMRKHSSSQFVSLSIFAISSQLNTFTNGYPLIIASKHYKSKQFQSSSRYYIFIIASKLWWKLHKRENIIWKLHHLATYLRAIVSMSD